MWTSWDLVGQPNLFRASQEPIEYFLNGGTDLAKVKLRDGESQDKLLRRFRKSVIRSGVLSEVRKRRWFVSKSEQRRMERKKAIRRIKKKARMNHRYDN
jgi:small subunit ribosomal protein S21